MSNTYRMMTKKAYIQPSLHCMESDTRDCLLAGSGITTETTMGFSDEKAEEGVQGNARRWGNIWVDED